MLRANLTAPSDQLADKASNLQALVQSPPAHWDLARVYVEYIAWAERVIAGARGVDARLEADFDASVIAARKAIALAG